MTLTDQECSLWIAEYLGWRFGTMEEYGPNSKCRGLGKCWWFNGAPYAFSELPNYVNDPAMTVMLIEKLASSLPNGDLHIEHQNGADWGVSCCYRNFQFEEWHKAKTLSRAVAEAFMLANGYEEGE